MVNQQYQNQNSTTIYTDQANQEIELVECIQTKSERVENEGFQQVFMTTNNSTTSNNMVRTSEIYFKIFNFQGGDWSMLRL